MGFILTVEGSETLHYGKDVIRSVHTGLSIEFFEYFFYLKKSDLLYNLIRFSLFPSTFLFFVYGKREGR